MDDIIVPSRFSKEETIKRLRHLFREGNDFSIELSMLHGEYYLSPAPIHQMGLIPGKHKSISLNPFYLQFRVKEQKTAGEVNSSIHITPQSKAVFIALSSMFLTLAWIIILVTSLAEKRWLDIEVYIIGIALTLIMILFLKLSVGKEKKVIERIVKEFE
ncbi:hypothetical protein H9Q13_06340 [Pontibacter sp. JH31]|uniref:Uncharacterized protein n=1 Tax=Pontibacter aquaedesilientis TaxID=2766980 RepID=A0ABR7XER8_9BACT|nr:hypothetical protein [Pontibacter aquaedesilientis]MBD1396779.1 hypothetical protein [Pontibacter aquaedesilientis]